MTIDRETLIRMACESGMEEPIEFGANDLWVANAVDLERFAALMLEYGRKPLANAQRRLLLDRLGANADGLDGDIWDQMVVSAVEAAHGITNKESSDAE